MPLLVFGVVRRGHPPISAGRARDDLGVRLVDSGELAAAVTEVDEETELTEEDAARHLDVLIMLLRDGPVLPLSFGTVSPDDDAVRAEVLDPVAADLVQRLDAVDGLVETRLEILFDESVALRDLMQSDPQIRDLSAQARGPNAALDTRIALGEAVSAGLLEWRQMRAEALLPGLAPSAESVAELESSDPLQQRWAFLVRSDGLSALDEAVGEVRSSLGTAASVEYVGPLPVYSFLEQVQTESAPPRSAWGW